MEFILKESQKKSIVRKKPGPRPMESELRRTEIIRVLANEQEKAKIAELAEEAGLSVSVYLRLRGLHKI